MHRAKVVATQNFVNLDLASLSATPTELFGHGASDAYSHGHREILGLQTYSKNFITNFLIDIEVTQICLEL